MTQNSSLRILRRLNETSSSLRRVDVAVYAIIFCIGAFQFFLCARAVDFVCDDVFWSDSGRALVERGFYGINGYSETNMPPGLPAILGVLGAVWGHSPSVFLHAMAVFGTLAFLAAYELLRRQAPRIVAAAICLLLMSSMTCFWLSTTMVWPSYAYMFAALGALLVVRKLEGATSFTWRVIWASSLAILVAASILLASAGIAFLGAILASIVVAIPKHWSLAVTRLKIYLPVLIVGLVVQGLWMHHGRMEASAGIAAAEWPIPGFPHSYLSQLKVKNGNDPELGLATPLDIVIRVADNARAQCELLGRMLLRQLPPVKWTSAFVILPLLFILTGWCSSVRRSKGGVQEWYFAAYEFIYLLWPWNLESRFFAPAAPLACLFLWRGVEAFVLWVRANLRVASVVSLPITSLLAVFAWFDVQGAQESQHRFVYLQDELSFTIWVLLGVLAAVTIWPDAPFLKPVRALARLLHSMTDGLRIDLRRAIPRMAVVFLAALILIGLRMQLADGRSHLDPQSAANDSPDAGAGKWIRDHTDKAVVVMARHVPIVYHYSARRVVWFPPSSDPRLLMKGIEDQKVDLVVVARREDSYYLPPDENCFAALSATYPNAFSLVWEGPAFRIFRVTGNRPSLGIL